MQPMDHMRTCNTGMATEAYLKTLQLSDHHKKVIDDLIDYSLGKKK